MAYLLPDFFLRRKLVFDLLLAFPYYFGVHLKAYCFAEQRFTGIQSIHNNTNVTKKNQGHSCSTFSVVTLTVMKAGGESRAACSWTDLRCFVCFSASTERRLVLHSIKAILVVVVGST